MRNLRAADNIGYPLYMNQMNDRERLIGRIYEAFNRREIDTVLAALHPAVDWPNGWEGGRVTGHDEVRSYWTRQWAAIDPTVVPTAFADSSDGRISVRVHQTVRDLSGNLLADSEVIHVYTFQDGLIKAMDIEPAPEPEIDSTHRQ
jgi:hypothetical protein